MPQSGWFARPHRFGVVEGERSEPPEVSTVHGLLRPVVRIEKVNVLRATGGSLARSQPPIAGNLVLGKLFFSP